MVRALAHLDNGAYIVLVKLEPSLMDLRQGNIGETVILAVLAVSDDY
jgi:hypothetical protein